VKLKDERGELDAPLDIRKKARENATAYFSASKEAEEKAKRTIHLIAETKARIEKLEQDGLTREELRAAEPRARKPRWFERYRWFISSDGLIVIGGRDASSNDRIVKRHLGEGDIYAHADVHGAPSVVVKRSGAEIPERTLREACEFALAGAASGSSYWVNPDQVSKTPESGEYLPKGAFVVRGRKNIHHDIEPRLGLGWIEHEGDRILMCGPESAVGARSQKTVIIQPGGDGREAVARRVAKELGSSVDDVLRLLPAGNSTVLLL
jgi:predicted ribosome quality control (RQC) complex YloA/Tae2 family protein